MSDWAPKCKVLRWRTNMYTRVFFFCMEKNFCLKFKERNIVTLGLKSRCWKFGPNRRTRTRGASRSKFWNFHTNRKKKFLNCVLRYTFSNQFWHAEIESENKIIIWMPFFYMQIPVFHVPGPNINQKFTFYPFSKKCRKL